MPTKEITPQTDNQRSLQPVDEETVRSRAYAISQSEDGGSPEENWYRAERELQADNDEK